MNINLKHCTTEENKRTLENLQQLYLHDLSEFASDLQIDMSGRFENDDIRHYFEKISLIPMLIRSEEAIVGFLLLNKPPYTPPNADYYINDIFICRNMRKKGIALKALKRLFEEFQGRYALVELKKNQNAVDFWHHTFNKLDIKFEETEMVEDGHDCLLQYFNID